MVALGAKECAFAGHHGGGHTFRGIAWRFRDWNLYSPLRWEPCRDACHAERGAPRVMAAVLMLAALFCIFCQLIGPAVCVHAYPFKIQ